MDLFNLKDKVVVLTGGLGQLGTELGEALLEYGATLLIVDLNEKKGIERINELTKKFKDNCFWFKCDITKKSEVLALKEFITKRFSKLDVLINCAGVGVYTPFEERTEEELDYVINVNLKGTINCSQVLGEIMKENKKGSIINIGSIYGVVSSDRRIYGESKRNNSEIYSITKAGIIHFTKYLATYWAQYNIRVNCLSPGGIFNNQAEFFVKNYCNKTPVNRMAATKDFSGIIVFLASDTSSYLTGQNIIVDGGFTIW